MLGAVLRNVFRLLDAFPGVYLVAVVSVAGSRRRQRIGDQAAGTSVYPVHPSRPDDRSGTVVEPPDAGR